MGFIPRPRPVGYSGGRRVKRDFWFSPAQGTLWPSDSDEVAHGHVVPDAMPQSWSWAVSHAELNDLWIVVPMHWENDYEKKREVNTVRASIWRTAKTRRGISLQSQVWDMKLYVRVTG